MAAIDELLLRPPKALSGIVVRESSVTGLWDEFDWDDGYWDAPDGLRFVVEMAVPAPLGAALWGVARWGVDRWSRAEWQDLTCRFQGVEWTRGGSPGGDDDPGELTVQLDNSDGRLLPWSADPFTAPAYMGAGTLMRVSVISDGPDPVVWWPQIVAVSSAWNETPIAGGQASWVSVPGFETISRLARVKPFAVTPVGAGDTATARFLRLLAAAEWKYGSDTTPIATANTYQATDLSAERLGELRDLARSWDARLRSDAQGRATMARTGTALVDAEGREIVLSNECGVREAGTMLRAPGGDSSATTNPAGGIDRVGDVTITLRLAFGSWTGSTGRRVLNVDPTTGGWGLIVANDGSLNFSVVVTGGVTRVMNSGPVGVANGTPVWLQVHYDDSARTTTFRKSSAPVGANPDDITWTTISTSAPHAGGAHLASTKRLMLGTPTGFVGVNATYWYCAVDLVGSSATLDLRKRTVGATSLVDAENHMWQLSPGAAIVADTVTAAERHVPYVLDSIETANDDESAVSVVNVSNEGGYETTVIDTALKDKHGWVDTDVELNVETGIQVAVGADLAARILTRARHAVRPVSCTLDSGNGADVVDVIVGMGVDRMVHVQRAGVRFSQARVCEAAHSVAPDGVGGVRWTVDVGFDVTTEYSWEAA